MAVDAAPSGKAPPGRLRFGTATRAPTTAFAVATRGSLADNGAAAAATGPHTGGLSAPPQPLRADERFPA